MTTFPAITHCEATMDHDQASALIRERDGADHTERSERLIELTELLPQQGMLGFSGQAAQWLFEDVKATWLYGCFTSTVLTAHAFCLLQLAGLIRMLPDDQSLPDEAASLEDLAELAVELRVIDIDLQADLVRLHDQHRAYTAANLHEHPLDLDLHLVESAQVTDEHPLVLDARHAIATSVRLVYT
jgi:hypothetical protein